LCFGQGGSIRLLAGNTGPGIFKDWPSEDAIIDVKQVKELQTITFSKQARVPYVLLSGFTLRLQG
jgi:hypothetical protein